MSNIFDLFKKIEKKENALPITHIIAGLGNPGAEYAKTRHNAGFMAIDFIASKCGVKIDRLKFKALTAEVNIGGARVLLMKPQTFMNSSGEAIGEASAFYKIPAENIIVLHDELFRLATTILLSRRKVSLSDSKSRDVSCRLVIKALHCRKIVMESLICCRHGLSRSSVYGRQNLTLICHCVLIVESPLHIRV